MKHNLIEYFKVFYLMGLQNSFPPESQCLFWALLNKFNSLLYRDNIRISNRELINLSGIPLRSFYRHREHLITYHHDDADINSWIVKYQEGSTREFGTYQMNFHYFQTFYRFELVPNMQHDGIIDIPANELVPNMQQNCQDTQLARSLKGSYVQNDDKFGTPSYTILDHTIQNNISINDLSINKEVLKPETIFDSGFLDKEFEELMKMDRPLRQKLLISKSINPKLKEKYDKYLEEQNEKPV